jgi:hypothetical protein
MTMGAERFVDAVYVAVYRTAIHGVLENLAEPPGRRPRQDLVDLSSWFNGLDEDGRDRVREVVRYSVDGAVFGMLAALDGVRALGLDGELSLSVNGSEIAPDQELHATFRSLVDEELGRD